MRWDQHRVHRKHFNRAVEGVAGGHTWKAKCPVRKHIAGTSVAGAEQEKTLLWPPVHGPVDYQGPTWAEAER